MLKGDTSQAGAQPAPEPAPVSPSMGSPRDVWVFWLTVAAVPLALLVSIAWLVVTGGHPAPAVTDAGPPAGTAVSSGFDTSRVEGL